MLANTLQKLPRTNESSRTVIVGGGTLGLYIARELVKRGRDVLVVESGGSPLADFPMGSYASVGRRHEGIRLGRARNLGGTSNLWGGQLVEFQSVDFAGRSWLPGSAWPISFEQVAFYHQRTYENLGIPSPFQDDCAVFNKVGGNPPIFGEGLELFFTRWLKIPSMSVAYDAEIRAHSHLQVLLNHTVVGFQGRDGRIESIEVMDSGGQRSQLMGGQFILANGTIEIARLLLHSAANDGWECPWRGNSNVGAYFQDHLVGRVGALEPLDRSKFFQTFSTVVWSGHKFQPKLRLTDATLTETRLLNVQAMMSFESSISENLVYLKQFLKAALYSRKIAGVKDFVRNLQACGKHLVPLMWKYVIDNRIFVPSTSKISLNIQSEQTPIKESRISIDSTSVDAFGLPKVILDWKVGAEELETIHEFATRCQKVMAESGLGKISLIPALERKEKSFLETLRDNYHHAGGARMGSNAADGVVDADLKVFGTHNLYIAGAATFRTVSNANTTFTALVLGTRLIDHLSSGSLRSNIIRSS
jgi:choline dehydrogenase-like flavoprotein